MLTESISPNSWRQFMRDRDLITGMTGFNVPKRQQKSCSVKSPSKRKLRITSQFFPTIEDLFTITTGPVISVPKKYQALLRKAKTNESGCFVVEILDGRQASNILTSQEMNLAWHDQVSASMKLAPQERKRRLRAASPIPKERIVEVVQYVRNPDVVAEVLHLAKGRCADCKSKAPFLRAKDNTPYLEVHHKTLLADGGEDTVLNAIALCPNCHKKRHFGL